MKDYIKRKIVAFWEMRRKYFDDRNPAHIREA